MHPIEHLRYVARAQGADPTSLVEETAHALGALRIDPAGLIVACRRIVERHPFTGPLWWLCAHVCTSSEPFDTVWELQAAIGDDPTPLELAAALPDDATVVTIGAPDTTCAGLVRRGDVRVLALDAGHMATPFVRRLERFDVDYEPVDAGAAGVATRIADVVLVEVSAADATRVVAPIGSSTIGAAAATWGTPVWLVAGRGRRLPSVLVDAMAERIELLGEEHHPWDLDVEILPTSLATTVVGPSGCVPCGPPAFAPECPTAAELLRHSPM